MQALEVVSGFSALKNILIRTYKIDRPKERIRLYFTESENRLLMHDFIDHGKIILLSFDGTTLIKEHYAKKLVEFALKEKAPSEFLNRRFLTDGYFIF